MDKLEKQLKKIFKNLHKNEERADSKWLSQTRLDLQKHMKENPAQKSAPVRSRIGSLFAKPMAVVSAVLIFLLAGGSTAMAAWSAAPGDILYPIKLASEKVTIVLSVDEETKAELHMKYADKRLEELEQISTDPDAARNTDSVALDRVVENMESHIVKIGEYLETPSESRHIAEVALTVAEFTQAQEESIKRIETRSSEIILPILPAVWQINDEQKQKVTQTLYAAREILEENIAKDSVSDEDEAIKQIVIKRINLLEGGEQEVVNAAVPVVDPKDGQDPSAGSGQVLESGVSSDEQISKDLSDHSNTISTDVSEEVEEDSVDGETEPTDNPNAIIIESNDTPEIQEDTSEEVTKSVVANDVADTPDSPAEPNTESVENEPMVNDEPDNSGEEPTEGSTEEPITHENITIQGNTDGEASDQSNEPNFETVSSDTSTGVLQTDTTSQTAATMNIGM